ncbi:MAG: hypothetical protein ABWY66_07555 [Xanthobacteraceae bacterium]
MTTPPRRTKASGVDASMITTAALPTTGTAVAAVLAASGGAEFVAKHFTNISTFEHAVIAFSAILSVFVTFISTSLPLLWRFVLWPLNFCILVYLVLASATVMSSIRYKDNLGDRATTFAVQQTITPGI